MPRYDIRCEQGHFTENVVTAWDDRAHPCPTCGAPTERVWISSFPNIIGDEIPGGMTIENMTAHPETFYSKSEHRRRVKELGLRVRDWHNPPPGSDKAKHTSRWI